MTALSPARAARLAELRAKRDLNHEERLDHLVLHCLSALDEGREVTAWAESFPNGDVWAYRVQVTLGDGSYLIVEVDPVVWADSTPERVAKVIRGRLLPLDPDEPAPADLWEHL